MSKSEGEIDSPGQQLAHRGELEMVCIVSLNIHSLSRHAHPASLPSANVPEITVTDKSLFMDHEEQSERLCVTIAHLETFVTCEVCLN